jgi:hypothetical protein
VLDLYETCSIRIVGTGKELFNTTKERQITRLVEHMEVAEITADAMNQAFLTGRPVFDMTIEMYTLFGSREVIIASSATSKDDLSKRVKDAGFSRYSEVVPAA